MPQLIGKRPFADVCEHAFVIQTGNSTYAVGPILEDGTRLMTKMGTDDDKRPPYVLVDGEILEVGYCMYATAVPQRGGGTRLQTSPVRSINIEP